VKEVGADTIMELKRAYPDNVDEIFDALRLSKYVKECTSQANVLGIGHKMISPFN